MAAASISKLIGKDLDISLIESDAIGTVGVGEATIPTMITLHQLLKIDEREFMAAVPGTFKLGISFENWKNLDENYIPPLVLLARLLGSGFPALLAKGKAAGGLSGEFGDYCTELQAAKNNKFAVMPRNGLNYAFHMDAGLYAKFLHESLRTMALKEVEGKITQVVTDPQSGNINHVTLRVWSADRR